MNDNTLSAHVMDSLSMSWTQQSRLFAYEACYEILRTLRMPSFVIPTLAFPVVFYLLFAVLLPGQWGSLHKASYLLATYGVFGVIGPALFGFGVGMAIDREQGLLELKRVSPMPILAYFVARIATSVVTAFAVVCLLSIVASLFGEVRLGLLQWVFLLTILLLGTFPFCAMGLLIGSLVKGQAAAGIVNLIYLPMSVLSGLWMPLFVFPTLVQKLAMFWPSWHLAQLALGIAGQIHTANALHVAVLVGYTLLFLGLAMWRMRVG
ncbi:MAG: ABC transporter permease [Lysobacteraceae bacterium]